MTMTHPSGTAVLDALEVPVVGGHVTWTQLSVDDLHQLLRGVMHHLEVLEPTEPTDGVMDRSIQLEETARALAPLQHRYAGLLEDAFNTPKLRSTSGLAKGKTPFRDATDLLAKTHGLRAFEATGRLRLARTLTPARASDPDREQQVAVGETKYPLLGALQAAGTLHPSKLSTAVNMLTELDDHADIAGKDQTFRDRLREVVEQDLVDKIEQTTPEEFSRYVSRRKAELIAAMDPPDRQFTTVQTEAMHTLRCEGPVRGNPNAHKWTRITDAEGNEALNAIAALVNNPRAKENGERTTKSGEATNSEDTQVVDRRPRGQRAMHAVRDAIKFALARLLCNTCGTSSEISSRILKATNGSNCCPCLRRSSCLILNRTRPKSIWGARPNVRNHLPRQHNPMFLAPPHRSLSQSCHQKPPTCRKYSGMGI